MIIEKLSECKDIFTDPSDFVTIEAATIQPPDIDSPTSKLGVVKNVEILQIDNDDLPKHIFIESKNKYDMYNLPCVIYIISITPISDKTYTFAIMSKSITLIRLYFDAIIRREDINNEILKMKFPELFV